MAESIQHKLFGGDRVKELYIALGAFLVLLLLIAAVFIASVIFKGESFDKACQAVQDNNAKLVTYLSEAENRSIERIKAEEKEGKIPLNTEEEIKASFTPLVKGLKPVEC